MKTIAATALILTSGLLVNSASAADPHLDDLAFSLKRQAALACREVRYGFRRTAAFPHLYRDFYEMYTLADHIHDVAHNHGDLRHLKDDVDQLDALFHHTEELTARTGNVRIARPGRSCLTVPACGGSVSQYHLRKLQRIMVEMEDTIHHLQDDLEAELGPVGPPLPPGQFSPSGPALTPPASPGRGNRGVIRPINRFPQGRSVGFRSKNGKVAFSIRIGR